jgi:methionine aminopeptidase
MDKELALRTFAYLIRNYKTHNETIINEQEIEAIEFMLKNNEDLEQQCKKQKEVIDKAMSILKDNFVYDYVRSCDTTDGVGYDEIDTEHFTYRVYKILKEVSE